MFRPREVSRLVIAALCGLALLVPLGPRYLAPRQAGCPPAVESAALGFSVSPRRNNSLIFDAALSLPQAAPVYLEYGDDRRGWLRTPTSPAALEHQIPLVRLRAETNYQVRAFALGPDGCPSAVTRAELATRSLPDQLRKLVVETTGRASFPLTTVDFRLADSGYRWLLALDGDSQVVWYYPVSREKIGSGPGPVGFTHLSNGNLAYIDRGLAEEITPDARVARRLVSDEAGEDEPDAAQPEGRRRNIHHDLTELPDGRLIYLGDERRVVDETIVSGRANRALRGDVLYILDPRTGAEDRVWSAFDSLDPAVRPAHWQSTSSSTGARTVLDWTHGNSVSVGPHGNLLVSFRHLDQVISLSPDLKTIEWKLGGVDSSFSFPDPSDQFYGQHAAVQFTNGNVLLFDNGNYRPEGDYSRGLELELDFSTMTARKVWEYRQDPIFSGHIGNAVRLANGNTLVAFGYRSDDPSAVPLLVESRPDGTAAWSQAIGHDSDRTLFYRAYPRETLAGEQPVTPTPLSSR